MSLLLFHLLNKCRTLQVFGKPTLRGMSYAVFGQSELRYSFQGTIVKMMSGDGFCNGVFGTAPLSNIGRQL